MNSLYKLWCRAYQTVFRIVIPVLPYREPKILGSMDELGPMFKTKGISRVLIVTDQGLVKAGIAAMLEEKLASSGIDYSLYADTVPNPTVANVEEARSQYVESQSQAIIALGGGSAMDCAKAAACRVARPRTSLKWMAGVLKVWVRLPLLVAVPTTAGTGSETTLAAVITDPKKHHKYAIMDFPLIPPVAVHDYRLTVGLPPHITSTTGMDALVHAVEAYIGRSTTSYTRAMAVEAVRLISENLLEAYRDGSNAKARQNMLRAAFCAGNAFSISYVGYVHCVAHSLGGQYGVPHGLANAVLLPVVLRAYGESVYSKLASLTRESGLAKSLSLDPTASDETVAKAFISWVGDMNRSMDIPSKIQGIKTEDICQMVSYALAEGNPLYPVPKLFGREELTELYLAVKE